MKKTKMSTRHTGIDKNEALKEVQQLEEQRINFEHGARLARTNLYNMPVVDSGRGWVDAKK